MSRLRIGFVGCGGIALQHLRDLIAVPEARVVAACDPDGQTRERFSTLNHPAIEEAAARDESIRALIEEGRKVAGSVEMFESLDEMLAKVDLDAALILTPHTLHYEQIKRCLEQDLHVLSEKPMVCRSKHARELIATARKLNRVLAVSYQRHFSPVYRYMKEVIDAGELGEVHYVSALLCQNWYGAVLGTWRMDPNLAGGGELMDSGSHVLDIILWTTGLRPVEVFARMECFDQLVDVNTALSLKFHNGAIGDIAIIGNTSIPFGEDLTITGSRGSFIFRQGEFVHLATSGKEVDLLLPEQTSSPAENFVESVMLETKLEIEPETAVWVALITEEAYRSVKTGSPITLLE